MTATIALPAPPLDVAGRLSWGARDSLVLALRILREIRHVPERLSDITVQPIIFVLLFAEVFGSAIVVPGGGSYHEYLLPGIIVQGVVFGCISSSVGMATDMHEGFVDRLIALPIARPAVLAGRLVAEIAQSMFGLVITCGMGFVVGWRIHRGPAHAAVAVLLLLLFIAAMQWLGIMIGLLIRAPDAAPGILFPIAFPLTFLANTFVPIGGLPAWLRVIAEWNPVSAIVAATRGQFGNPNPGTGSWPLQHAVPMSMCWSLLLITICATIALRRWRTVTSR